MIIKSFKLYKWDDSKDLKTPEKFEFWDKSFTTAYMNVFTTGLDPLEIIL